MFTEEQTMFRLLGFLIGSLTSVLVILLIVGMPKIQLSDAEISQERYDAAIEKLRAKQLEIETVTGRLTEDVARVADSFDDDVQPQVDEVSLPASAPPLFAEKAPELPVVFEEAPAIQAEPSWYSFWNPFRSEIAANGFVAQLEKVTGLDYRVVKVETGVYEVAFAYNDDAERKAKLSQIALATGLELPDS